MTVRFPYPGCRRVSEPRLFFLYTCHPVDHADGGAADQQEECVPRVYYPGPVPAGYTTVPYTTLYTTCSCRHHRDTTAPAGTTVTPLLLARSWTTLGSLARSWTILGSLVLYPAQSGLPSPLPCPEWSS